MQQAAVHQGTSAVIYGIAGTHLRLIEPVRHDAAQRCSNAIRDAVAHEDAQHCGNERQQDATEDVLHACMQVTRWFTMWWGNSQQDRKGKIKVAYPACVTDMVTVVPNNDC